jgi:hypothetical protein
MNEQKGLFTQLGEVLDRHWAKRRAAAQAGASTKHPRRLRWLGRQMLPNIGTLLLVVALLLTQNAWARPAASPAAAPGPSATTVNYQGRLADPGGNPLDGNYGMSFSLWDAAADGNLAWGPESHTAVPVSEGLFSVGLGSQTSGGIPTSVWNGDRYLEITVGGETLSPRELIGSVPIAGMALTVPDGAIGSRHFAPSWYEDFNPSRIEITSSSPPVSTGVSVTFTCDTDCTALILHRGLVEHSVVNGRTEINVWVDDALAFRELGAANVNYGGTPPESHFHAVEGFDFVNLSAGSHTVEVKFRCSTSGTCYYYGDSTGEWEHLNVLVFSQP